jgi:hypothetical protein
MFANFIVRSITVLLCVCPVLVGLNPCSASWLHVGEQSFRCVSAGARSSLKNEDLSTEHEHNASS